MTVGLLDSILAPMRQGGAGVAYRGSAGTTTTGTGLAYQPVGKPASNPAPGTNYTRPAGMPDYEWLVGSGHGACDGLTACESIAGNPSSYSQTGNTFTLAKGRGTPWVMGGWFTSLTAPKNGAVVGAQSYGGDNNCTYLGNLTNPNLAFKGFQPVPFQEGEILTQYGDTTAADEAHCQATLVVYGQAPGHPYPESVEEVIKYSGLSGKVKEIWNPIGTTTGSVTVMTGGVALGTAMSTGTKWVDADSAYYILGARSINVGTVGGFLNISGGMPGYMMARNNLIPVGDAESALKEGCPTTFPYHAIGPFTSSDWPLQSMISFVASAHLHTLCIAKT